MRKFQKHLFYLVYYILNGNLKKRKLLVIKSMVIWFDTEQNITDKDGVFIAILISWSIFFCRTATNAKLKCGEKLCLRARVIFAPEFGTSGKNRNLPHLPTGRWGKIKKTVFLPHFLQDQVCSIFVLFFLLHGWAKHVALMFFFKHE